MMPHVLCLVLLVVTLKAHSYDELAVLELNPELIPIYESLVADGESTELIGKRFKITLELKFSSEKHLLFSDTRVSLDNETKYYLVKWKFDPRVVEEILGMSGVKCTIRGKIIEVIKGSTSPNMPYVIAELESVEI